MLRSVTLDEQDAAQLAATVALGNGGLAELKNLLLSESSNVSHLPDVFALVALLLATFGISLLRGRSRKLSLLGVACGSTGYWALLGVQVWGGGEWYRFWSDTMSVYYARYRRYRCPLGSSLCWVSPADRRATWRCSGCR